MSSKTQIFIVNNIKIPVNASQKEAFSIAKDRLRKLRIDISELELSIYRRSVDARRKNDIKFVYSVSARGCIPIISEAKLKDFDISVLETADIAASASPLKPSVLIAKRSSFEEILLVACFINAVFASSADIPHPLSVTRMYSIPLPLISMVILVAPASTEFSTSSLTSAII